MGARMCNLVSFVSLWLLLHCVVLNRGRCVVVGLKRIAVLLSLVLFLSTVSAVEFHVAVNGKDQNAGTAEAPFRTIQHAAEKAQPGDTITVHEGVYRERINPPRGGESVAKRIVYRAAPGEKVEIKGSEVIKDWAKVQGDVWKVVIPNTFFGDFNPYNDLIRGDWFKPMKRQHHTGAVYLNGDWLVEAAKLKDVLVGAKAKSTALWFAQVDSTKTTIHAQFKGVNPNERQVEINVRRTVFYPAKPGINFITVRGFTLCHAATPWAPPTAEQIGLIGTHWSKGWIIEKNTISHSVCSGIALGKHGDEFDNTSANSAEGYVKTIERAHAFSIPWTKEHIGHHIVRDNTISHCEQTGIVGSMGAAFSTITNNTIHDIHVRRLFSGHEMAGIKLHAPIDVTIRGNQIYRTTRGLWLDWMTQGTRVTGNLFHQNRTEDLYVEVNHGPFMVDNNLFLSKTALKDASQGGAYVHNLFAGRITVFPQKRMTPYHPAHETAVAALINVRCGDDRYYNNIFVGSGLQAYNKVEFPLFTGGNVYYRGGKPHAKETGHAQQSSFDPKIKLVQDDAGVQLHLNLDASVQHPGTVLVTSELLGKARIPQVGYENPDGSPLKLDTDYFGKPRDPSHPTAGPFEKPGAGALVLKVR